MHLDHWAVGCRLGALQGPVPACTSFGRGADTYDQEGPGGLQSGWYLGGGRPSEADVAPAAPRYARLSKLQGTSQGGVPEGTVPQRWSKFDHGRVLTMRVRCGALRLAGDALGACV